MLALFFFLPSVWAASPSLIDKIEFSGIYKTDALIISKDDRIVYEEYRHGYSADSKHRLWSVSKSLTSLLVGMAVKEGRLRLDDNVCSLVGSAAVSNDLFCSMTVNDLLHWQSGIQWKENYFSFEFKRSSVLAALYGPGILDFGSYFLSLPFAQNPGLAFNYSTGDSHFLSYLLKQVYSPEEYIDLPWKKLFDPVGIQSATLERDQSGTFLFGSYLYMSIYDLLKIARFVLNEYMQSQLLPEGWMKAATTPRKNVRFKWWHDRLGKACGIPAGHWWTNRPVSEDQDIPWASLPPDAFAAFGVFGQIVVIIPSENAIFIRLARDAFGAFNRPRFMRIMYEALKERENL